MAVFPVFWADLRRKTWQGFDADLSYAVLNATGEKVAKAAESSGNSCEDC